MSVGHEPCSYGGWSHCHRIGNGRVDLVVSGGFGPRVLRFGFTGGANVLFEQYQVAREQAASAFRLYGGHRLWPAPEDPVRTAVPDNQPIAVSFAASRLSAAAPADPVSWIAKRMSIELHPALPQVRVTHELTNAGAWTIEVAAWALSMLPPGGLAVLPLPPRRAHADGTLLPSGKLVLWPYTDLGDPRWRFEGRRILLAGDPDRPAAQKLGAPVADGWLAYWRQGTTFVKRFAHDGAATYPDDGCSGELFTNGLFVELESLGPLTRLAPGATVAHTEDWELTTELPAPDAIDAEQYCDLIRRGAGGQE